MTKTQREYFLREQLKAIQQELGQYDEIKAEVDEYREKIQNAGMPEEVEEKALKELGRFEKMPQAAAESGVIRTYLDWLIGLPWNKETEEKLDLIEAREILDEDHYGLEKVKERILEYLAVHKLTDKMRGPILCFVGPPGVGKTSIGRSIARALEPQVHPDLARRRARRGRDPRPPAHLRRRAAGPHHPVDQRRSGTRNPVFMMDEIDKVGHGLPRRPDLGAARGAGPGAELLASRTTTSRCPFDLSDVMFITTANLLDTIPPALRDRMEVIHFSGYTEDEKLHIAREYLVPKQLEEHGLTAAKVEIADSALLRDHPPLHARGRRAQPGALDRRDLPPGGAQGRRGPPRARPRCPSRNLHDVPRARQVLLRPRRGAGRGRRGHRPRLDRGRRRRHLHRGDDDARQGQPDPDRASSATSCASRAQAAVSPTSGRAPTDLGIDAALRRDQIDLHIHVPAAAIPKDGPSAGITMATAMASALMGCKVRRDIAMTGEITLRGHVLPIGGLKEKLLAAHRAGRQGGPHPQGERARPRAAARARARGPGPHPGREHGRGAGARAGRRVRTQAHEGTPARSQAAAQAQGGAGREGAARSLVGGPDVGPMQPTVGSVVAARVREPRRRGDIPTVGDPRRRRPPRT